MALVVLLNSSKHFSPACRSVLVERIKNHQLRIFNAQTELWRSRSHDKLVVAACADILRLLNSSALALFSTEMNRSGLLRQNRIHAWRRACTLECMTSVFSLIAHD
ncbi:hypothetical protein TRVL_07416 [Trypanosoma vivax]|nr:hypothetical protein TRVL_07416 [Trypanosoma vivax]